MTHFWYYSPRVYTKKIRRFIYCTLRKSADDSRIQAINFFPLVDLDIDIDNDNNFPEICYSLYIGTYDHKYIKAE